MLVGSLAATPGTQENLVGCLNRLSDGTLQFGAVPSGQLFLVRGQTKAVEAHVNQLVRVFGRSSQNSDNNKALPNLTVNRVQALAESCTSALPGKQSESVPGKVGEDLVAVPVTSSVTEAETTPGFQTEAVTVQSSPSQGVLLNPSAEPPAAPAHADQVAQSEAAANVNSSAVERTEILPAETLGVSPTAGSAETPSSGAPPVAGRPTGIPVDTVTVTVTISGSQVPQLSPSRVNIKVGQVVGWLNSSGAVQEVIGNPARETQPSNTSLPARAQPFDSGFLRPSHSFRHYFSVPGRYRYVCKINDSENPSYVTGEVIVAP